MRTLAIALSIVSLILSSYSLYLSFKNQRNAEEKDLGKYHITHDYDSLLDELFGAYDDFIKK